MLELNTTTAASTTLKPLEQLVTMRDSSEIPVKVFYGHNLGNGTLTLRMSMHEFFRMSQVANERGENGEPVAQRKLDLNHAQGLAQYMLRGLIASAIDKRKAAGQEVHEDFYKIQERMGKRAYMSLQPIVANIRTCGKNGTGLNGEALFHNGESVGFRFWLAQRDILWIVDGQHRRKAMDLVFQFLEDIRVSSKYPKKKQSLFPSEDPTPTPGEQMVWGECFEVARAYCTIMIEVHLGLGITEERQLFHDLNNLGKKVESSLALEFDSSNPINEFIKEKLIGSHFNIRVSEKDVSNWADDDGSIVRKFLVAINAHLFLNKSNINGALPHVVQHAEPVAIRFWEAVTAIPGFGEEAAKMLTVAAQPVVLKALAKLTYDFAFGRNQDDEQLRTLLDGITDIDFSHKNPVWRYYDLSEQERASAGIADLKSYLPSDDEGKNRDVGNYDTSAGIIRFGAKHNDIFPIIGDMVRWMLKLPSRHA